MIIHVINLYNLEYCSHMYIICILKVNISPKLGTNKLQ